MKKTCLLVCALTVLMLPGCARRLGDFTILSSKNVNVLANRGERVKGKDCMVVILGIPAGEANFKNAVDRAIESAGPGFDALEDAVIRHSFFYLLIAGQACYEVEGTAINTKRGQASARPDKVLYHSLSKLPQAKAWDMEKETSR